MDSWIQDLRYAVRSIAGAKKFAVLVLATLAFGIGANSAVFSVLNAVVLQPLPYHEPERLIRVYQSTPRRDCSGRCSSVSVPRIPSLSAPRR
jgi:putative ABC transport system permease protein